jgi:hypothetical protein
MVIISIEKEGNPKCLDGIVLCHTKKESIYKIKTEVMSMNAVKSIVFRFIEVYYNRKRIYTTNGGYPPLVKRSHYYRKNLLRVG